MLEPRESRTLKHRGDVAQRPRIGIDTGAARVE